MTSQPQDDAADLATLAEAVREIEAERPAIVQTAAVAARMALRQGWTKAAIAKELGGISRVTLDRWLKEVTSPPDDWDAWRAVTAARRALDDHDDRLTVARERRDATLRALHDQDPARWTPTTLAVATGLTVPRVLQLGVGRGVASRIPSGGPNILPDDLRDADTMRRLYLTESLTMGEIAGQYHCSRNVVAYAMALHGIEPRTRHGRRPSVLSRTALLQAATDLQSQPLAAVARSLGVKPKTLRGALIREGLAAPLAPRSP